MSTLRPAMFASLGAALLTSMVACKDQGQSQDQRQTAPAGPAGPAEPAEPPAPATKPEPPPPPDPATIALADAVDPARFEADLRLVAAERAPGSSHWQAVQDHCAAVFEAAGFETTRFEAEGAGVNVVGRKLGSQPELPEIVVGAHYDHIEGCAGADDNASGTAAVLELARVLGAHSWPRSLTVACWDREESGLEGSGAWADAAVADGRAIGLYLNFDAMAYANAEPHTQTLPPGMGLMFPDEITQLEAREFRADFIAVLADDGAHASAEHFVAHAARLELPAAWLEIPAGLKNADALADLRRSDHASFWAHDIPAVFLSDTANFRTDTYHCKVRPDTVETLDLAFATKVVRASAGALAATLAP